MFNAMIYVRKFSFCIAGCVRSVVLMCMLFMAGIMEAQTRMDTVLAKAQLANKYFMESVPDPTADSHTDKVRPSHIWTRGVYYEGLMSLYDIDPQEKYIEYTDTWASYHGWAPRSTVWKVHADDQCCTQTYMTRYFQVGGSEKYVKAQQDFDNQMSGNDRSVHDHDWTWIDAIQMSMPALAMLTKITGERKYMDFAMQSYTWTRNSCNGKALFVENEGLWWRDANLYGVKENDGKNSYWSRGNGWVYVALQRVMDQLDEDDEYYQQLKDDYMLMSSALPAIQREDGFWNASLVSSEYNGPELTGTALFLSGLSWGLRKGYLVGDEYREAADRAWEACKACVHDNGFLGYVQGTSDRPSKGWPFTYDAVPNFEDFGTGCFLLGVTEYYKLLATEQATGVDDICASADDVKTVAAVYDLMGRKVVSPVKGRLYIVNGEKRVWNAE